MGSINCTIVSQTVATQPSDRARTKIGVGEEVTCTFSLGNATWSLSGVGKLSVFSGGAAQSVTYTAPDTAGTATLTATGSGCTDSIKFTIVAPSEVNMVRISDVEHNQETTDIGMWLSWYIGPDDVSFYNIQVHEVNCMPTSSGVYSCITEGHSDNPATVSAETPTTVVPGKGTKMHVKDHHYSGDCDTDPDNDSEGSVVYAIPYEYNVGSGSFHRFCTVFSLSRCSKGGKLFASKGGADASTTINSPTVTVDPKTLTI